MNLKSLTPNPLVESVNKTVEYYEKTLGVQTMIKVPETGALEFSMLKLDNVSIMFQSIKGFKDAMPAFKDMNPGMPILLYFEVADLDPMYSKVTSEKAEVVKGIHTTFYGTREFTIKDCDGNLLIFAEKK